MTLTTVTREQVAELVELVQRTRLTQREYRRTMDSTLRYRVAEQERQLDALAEAVAAQLRAEGAAAAEWAASVEGGAA